MKWTERTTLPYNPELARQMVACKIRHVYGLSESDFTMSDAVAKPYLMGAQQIIGQSTRFATSKNRAIEESKLSTEEIAALDVLIPKIFEYYGHGFEVREKVMNATTNSKHPKGFNKRSNRIAMADAYINHISNAAQRALSAIGLNTKSAISLHGMIIEAALSCRYGSEEIGGDTRLIIPGDNNLAYVEPAQAPENRPAPSAAVKQLEWHWRKCGRDIKQSCYPHHR